MYAPRLLITFKNVALQGTAKSLITKPSNISFVKSYRGTPKSRFQNNEVKEVNILKKPVIGPLKVGQAAVAGGGILGLGALCFYGLGLANEPGAIDKMYIWPQYVKTRIRDTYLYFGASVGVIAAASISIFRSPMGHRFIELCSRHPIMSTVGIIAGLIGTSQAMMTIPYSPGLGTKQMMWLVNCGMIGLAIAPVGIFGGVLAIRAAWYTAGLVGGLSTVAICAPSEKFLNWAGPLGLGLGGVIIASLGSAFLPPTTALGMSLYSFSIYGGLLIFSGLLLYDTQKIIQKAESHPSNYYGIKPYDPINASHRVVMDVVNIFVRIVQILAMGGGMKRK